MPADPRRPVLWHLAMSHYNEKARWALDYKQVPHTRRAVMPGLHVLVAKHLGGGETFPVMTVGDQVYPDSTDIIAALEALQPDPPLYPEDPALRKRALELEDEFDRKLGPAVRRLGYQHILESSETAAAFLSTGGPPLRRTILKGVFRPMSTLMRNAFQIPERDDPRSLATMEHYLETIDTLTADTGFLVGDQFSIADLTAAALLGTAVCPELIPNVTLPPLPEALLEIRGDPSERAGGEYVQRMFRDQRAANRVSALS